MHYIKDNMKAHFNKCTTFVFNSFMKTRYALNIYVLNKILSKRLLIKLNTIVGEN